jgi:hypothetical protein
MLEGIDVGQRINFTSKKDKTEPKTVFVLRPLSGIDRLNILQSVDSSVQTALETSIVEIKNNNNISKEDYIKTLDLSVLDELMEKINNISNIKDDDEKNS